MGGSALQEKSCFKILGLTFGSKLVWDSYTISVTKTTSKKIGALIHSMKFLSPEAVLISINIPYGYTWNVVMPGLVFLGATWNC